MKYTLRTSKGSRAFKGSVALAATVWLEELQPAFVFVSVDGRDDVEFTWDGPWEADAPMRRALRACVAERVGVSKSLLRMWSGKPGGRHTMPSEGDAERVETAVRALLQDCIAKLDGERW